MSVNPFKAKFVELHLLQNFPPSCVNRDGNNSPKDCEFGGVRRARISSQCLKRATRVNPIFENMVGHADRTRLNRQIVRDILDNMRKKKDLESKLKKALPGESESDNWVAELVDSIAGPVNDNPAKTSVLLFFGEDEWRAMIVAKLKGSFDPKKRSVDPKSADILLFGRMLAEAPKHNVDAACQVAHALSTNKLSQEMDYWTAMDEKQPQEEPGAGNIGNQEFNSSCFYRYACISVTQLQENYHDKQMTRTAIEAFLRASYEAIPTGKLNSSGHFTPPEFAMIIVRHQGYPRNLVNAFDKPVSGGKDGLTAASVAALCRYYDLRCESESDNQSAFDGYWWCEGRVPQWWDDRPPVVSPKKKDSKATANEKSRKERGWVEWNSKSVKEKGGRRSEGYSELVTAALEQL